ncbi:MAG: fasciclin domain-containing protein [Gramella sp.]|nr:fasciclin domain-containing protein [Christiangramia sp.]
MKNYMKSQNLILKSLFFAFLFVFASCETEPVEADISSFDASAKAAEKAKPSPASQKSDMTIVEIAEANGNFTILLDLLEQTGLKPVFEGTDQFTVFAPTDGAFLQFLDENPNFDLSNNELLTAVLTYHVTEGQRFSNSVLGKNNPKEIEMLSGGMIYVNSIGEIDTNDEDMDKNSSILVDAGLFDIAASNGVIHAIDTILVPAN